MTDNKTDTKCEKIAYGSELEADLQLDVIRTRKIRDTTPIRSYKCERCGKYHLTSQQKKRYE